MARPRRYGVSKRRPARRRSTRSGNSGTSFVSLLKGYALLKLKQKLGLNPESKYVDVAGTTTSTGTLQSRIAAPTIAQGLTNQTRTGATVRISKVETRISIVAATAATSPTTIRIIQVRNKRAASAQPADILQTTTDISSPLQSDYQANGVQILKDITVCLGTATGGDGCQWVEWTHTGLSDHVTWPDSDTTGLPGAAEQGCISTYWMVDNVSTSPVFTSKSRYWYVDN